MMNETQVKNRIYELEKEIAIYKKILETPSEKWVGRPKGSTTYTIEQIKFLEECEALKLTDKAIIQEYNKKFNTKIPSDGRQLYNLMVRLGIKKQVEKLK